MKLLIQDLWQQDRRAFLHILGMQILSSLLGGVGIVMLIPLLELLESGGFSPGQGLLPLILGLYLVLITGKALLNRRLTITQTAFLEGYTFRLRNELYDALSAAGWQRLASYQQADLIGLFTTQCTQVSSGVSCLIRLLTSLVSAAIQIAIACWMSLPVTVTVLVCGGTMMVFFLPLRKKARQYGDAMIAVSRDFYGELFHQLNSVKEIRTYGVEETHRQRFAEYNRAFGQTQVAYAKVHTLPSTVSAIASGAMLAGVAALCLMVWQLDVTKLVILVLIFSRLWPLFSSWQNSLQSIQANVPALEKLKQTVADLGSAAVIPDLDANLSLRDEIRFSHVSFRYQGSDAPVLEDVNFSLHVGKITALVGPSGAGKSTTADLLMGFLTPETGQILIDGHPLTPETGQVWRKSIGYIPQSPLILNASIRENLSRFHPDATQEDMIVALTRAAAWDFVKQLPQQLDTVLGDQGIRLSGGERQRIVLARVLLGQPKLLVLDEATSALDYESETAIRDVLDSLRGDAAILVIAHRLATVAIADEAVVLTHKTVTEHGPFPELIRNPGGYLAGMVTMG